MRWTRFLDKNVKLIKADGFVKHGKLVTADDEFIQLEYPEDRGGGAELIAVAEIRSVSLEAVK